jgi:large subunit ribosomal protein L3
MGYHKRIELSKWIVNIADSGAVDKVNPSSGFPHYGFVKNDYVLIKGSVAGPARRLVRLRYAMRKSIVTPSSVSYVSIEPKN